MKWTYLQERSCFSEKKLWSRPGFWMKPFYVMAKILTCLTASGWQVIKCVFPRSAHHSLFKGESTKKGSLNYVQMFYNAMKIFARKHFSGQNRGLFIFRSIWPSISGRNYPAGRVHEEVHSCSGQTWPSFLSRCLVVKEYWEYYVRYRWRKRIQTVIYILIFCICFHLILSMYLSGSYDRDSNPLYLRGIF